MKYHDSFLSSHIISTENGDGESDNESVVSDYSEIGDAFKEHLTTSFSEGELKLIAKHDLTSGDFRLDTLTASSTALVSTAAPSEEDQGVLIPDGESQFADDDPSRQRKSRVFVFPLWLPRYCLLVTTPFHDHFLFPYHSGRGIRRVVRETHEKNQLSESGPRICRVEEDGRQRVAFRLDLYFRSHGCQRWRGGRRRTLHLGSGEVFFYCS